MHDFNELQPEEQAFPGIIEDLRTTYQLKPQERQVLERVRARLAQHAEADSSLEGAEPSPLVTETSRPATPERSRPRLNGTPVTRIQPFQRNRLNTLVAALICCVLVGTLAIALGVFYRNQTIGGSQQYIHFVLIPTNSSDIPSQTALDATRDTLLQRFANFGLQGSSVTLNATNGKPQFEVRIPHFGGNEQQTINTLVGTDMLAFWNTNTDILPAGTHFDSSKYVQYNPGGKPVFTGQDLDTHALSIYKSEKGGTCGISFSMNDEARQRFSEYTGEHVNSALTVTLDNRVLASATIVTQIASGDGQTSGNYTLQQAHALIASLKAGSLAVPLQQA